MNTRILVVDDEPAFTRYIKLSLERQGEYQVREVNDPAKAVTAAREFRPQVILLDVMLPGTDGGEVAAQFKEDPFLHAVPVIFLTALVTPQDSSGVGQLASGGQVFLSKCLDWVELVECIRQRIQPQAAMCST